MVARLDTGSNTLTFNKWQRLGVRAQTIACAEAAFSIRTCAWSCACSLATARLWQIRWQEQTGSKRNLADLARSGRPATITLSTQLKVIAFYCQKKPLPGVVGWTLSTATNHLKKNPELLR